jgi:hypothetical protein
MSKKSKLIAAAAIAVLSLSSQAFARGGLGGGFGGGHMASRFHSFNSAPPTSFHMQSPTFNPSESYTLPEPRETPVSPNG